MTCFRLKSLKIIEKRLKGKKGNGFDKLKDKYTIKYVGGDINLENNPNLRLKSLQNNSKNLDIISYR